MRVLSRFHCFELVQDSLSFILLHSVSREFRERSRNSSSSAVASADEFSISTKILGYSLLTLGNGVEAPVISPSSSLDDEMSIYSYTSSRLFIFFMRFLSFCGCRSYLIVPQ